MAKIVIFTLKNGENIRINDNSFLFVFHFLKRNSPQIVFEKALLISCQSVLRQKFY